MIVTAVFLLGRFWLLSAGYVPKSSFAGAKVMAVQSPSAMHAQKHESIVWLTNPFGQDGVRVPSPPCVFGWTCHVVLLWVHVVLVQPHVSVRCPNPVVTVDAETSLYVRRSFAVVMVMAVAFT